MAISIVMATRNALTYLPRALRSIDAAVGSGRPVEIVAADASSTDATVSMLMADPRIRLVSTSDTGIYDGMNRAISSALHDFVMILNSDDELPSGALKTAIMALNQEPNRAWASGQALFRSAGAPDILRRNQSPLSAEGAMFGIPAINARLFRRSALMQLGPIRTDLGLAADREWMLRLARSGEQGIDIQAPMYIYRMHQGSSTIAGDKPGRMRVYSAERQLAAGLSAGAQADCEVAQLVRRLDAVAATKQKLTRKSDEALPSVMDAVKGFVLARRWRGVLSGY